MNNTIDTLAHMVDASTLGVFKEFVTIRRVGHLCIILLSWYCSKPPSRSEEWIIGGQLQ